MEPIDDELPQSAEDAARLDRLLAMVPAPSVPPALAQRILGEFDRRHIHWSFANFLRSVADAIWPGGPVWVPAGVLAAAFAVGLGVAAFAPLDVAQPDAGAFALDNAPDIDAGHGI
jgi:hypothetical protein